MVSTMCDVLVVVVGQVSVVVVCRIARRPSIMWMKGSVCEYVSCVLGSASVFAE